MTRVLLPALATILALTAAPALAQQAEPTITETPDGVMTYGIFEPTVEHGDMAECPAALAQEGRMCRLVLQNDALWVFAFAEGGDMEMQAVAEYPLDGVSFPE